MQCVLRRIKLKYSSKVQVARMCTLSQHFFRAQRQRRGARQTRRTLGPRGHRRSSEIRDVKDSALAAIEKDGGGGGQVEAAESQKQHLQRR